MYTERTNNMTDRFFCVCIDNDRYVIKDSATKKPFCSLFGTVEKAKLCLELLNGAFTLSNDVTRVIAITKVYQTVILELAARGKIPEATMRLLEEIHI